MNTSWTSVCVISPSSHLDASPLSACQNCCRDSLFCSFLDRNSCRSRVLLGATWKQFLHLSIMSRTPNVQTDKFGCLSLNIFLAGSPTERKSQVTTFFSAASSAISPISAFILGLFTSVVLVNSSIEIEYFAMTATANKSNHRSHSISGDLVLSDQNSGRPGNKEGFSFCVDAVEVSRSAMLKTTERQCTRNEEEEITMYYELYLEVKATATKHSVCISF